MGGGPLRRRLRVRVLAEDPRLLFEARSEWPSLAGPAGASILSGADPAG
jgi:hypothetical protein